MLKLYTNTDFLVEAHRREVFPLLFDLVFKKNKNLLRYYQIVEDIKIADVVVCPINYEAIFKHHRIALNALLDTSKKHNKTLWVFTAGDYGFTTFLPNVFTFRSGGFNSTLSENVFVLPSFINDPYNEFLNSDFKPLPKQEKPSIGFVGHAQSGILKYLKEYNNHLKYQFKRFFRVILADKQKFYPSSVKRARYLQKLALNKDIDTSFVLRHKYRAGEDSPLKQKQSEIEFYNNIFKNAYTFCLRGVGNFSVRFYETLAVGRIPIVINTDCRFPLENEIDWHKQCLIIDETSKKPLVKHILEFHNNLSASEFEAIQKSNRDLWLNVLTREAYFLQVYKAFKTHL
ncbi:exostosin domain-containing protein [Jejuia pallidilutea]|uniref:Exostosin GT47 domain-containing protein n=1 Tax=Jejuia pallidilutea TaxID=504487 RepID=A0A090W5C8_9FLAO|nr:exostosin family protein [Jejuia pallidilutea]GAL67605.1 hypothetical protein JCM19301_892 [Jejuia pallidilutea]GAL71413.1 hypothetical protein JCM19302_1091 [Jejuia pallidilutea]GAL89425.1 hypothetical protein JCM19538_1420 [Jejuia pallidilutea]